MASSDDVATDQFRDLTDVKAALITGVCTVTLILSLGYDADIEVSFVHRLSPFAPYFAYVFSRGAVLSAWTWMAPIAVVTLGTFGFLMS